MKAENEQIKPHWKAHEFLQMAYTSLTSNARLRDQPDGERSAKLAAEILTAWTGMEWKEGDVWRCLLAVKLARERQGDFHADDYVDIAGYAALLGEHQSSLRDKPQCQNPHVEIRVWGKRIPPHAG